MLQDDAIIYAIVSDSEAVERRCESRQSLDSRFGFLKWLYDQTGLDFFENEAGNRAWKLGRDRVRRAERPRSRNGTDRNSFR